MPALSKAFRKRVLGLFLIGLGVLALCAPLAAGRWSLAILGIPLIALSVAEAYAAFVSPQRAEASAYLPSLLAMPLGNILLLSSALVLDGLLVLLVVVKTAFRPSAALSLSSISVRRDRTKNPGVRGRGFLGPARIDLPRGQNRIRALCCAFINPHQLATTARRF
jgi:uncharacterized membrane protein HdeD (DUF308 family)